MKKIHRCLALLLALVMVLSMAACSAKEDAPVSKKRFRTNARVKIKIRGSNYC